MFVGTATPLGSGTDYASEWRMSGNSDHIIGSVFSDVAGTLFIEQGYPRPNGTIDPDVSSSYPVAAGDGSGFTEGLVAPKWRVRFNQTGTQNVFRLSARASSDGGQA